MFLQRKVVGDSPLYVRRVGERHKIVRQTDSGFGVDARAGLGSPSSPEALLNSSLPHDLVMGGISRAGSQHQGCVPVLLENFHGMSCSGTCWFLGGAWFQCRYGGV